MAAKRRAHRPSSGDFKEMGRNGGNEGSSEEEEEGVKSGETAISAEPKDMPLKQAEQPSSPSSEDAGAQGSSGGFSLRRRPPPASQEEDEAEDSGDASPARGPLPDDSADAGHDKKMAATPKRGQKRSQPPRQEEGRPKKRAAAGPYAETVAASAPQRKKKKSKRSAEKEMRKEKKSKRSAEKEMRKKKKSKRSAEKDRRKKKRKKQLRKDTPSSQEDEHHGREMAGQEQSNTSPPQDEQDKKIAGDTSPPHGEDMHTDTPSSPVIGREMAEQEKSNTSSPHEEHGAREEQQQEEKIAEQEHDGDTSPPRGKDKNTAYGDDQQEEEVASQDPEEEQQGKGILQQEQPNDTSLPQEKNRVQEDEETGAKVNGKALQVRDAQSTKPHSSETEKKPASWSSDDELKILNALVVHAQSHNGVLPESSQLLANLTFDKADANEDKLTDKIRKLKRRYHKLCAQGCPSDDLSRRLFKLSGKLWGQVDEDEQVEPTFRDFSVLSKLYPHLAKEVKAYAEAHSSGDLVMAMFMTVGDEKARDLDAKCKKQQIEAFKLELGQASLISELLSTLTHGRF